MASSRASSARRSARLIATMAAMVGTAGASSRTGKSSAPACRPRIVAPAAAAEEGGAKVEAGVGEFLERLRPEVPPVAIETAISGLSHPRAGCEEHEHAQLVGPEASGERGQVAAQGGTGVARVPHDRRSPF